MVVSYMHLNYFYGYTSSYLASSVDIGVVETFFPRDWVPVCLAVHLGVLLAIDNSSKGRGDDNSLNRWGIGLNGLEDTSCSLDRGVQEVLDGVINVKVERGCRVKHIIERRVCFDGLNKLISRVSSIA